MAVALRGHNLAAFQFVTLAHGGEHASEVFLRFVVVVARFLIHFDESVKGNHLAVGHELLVAGADFYVDSGLLYLGVGHL